MQSLREKLTDSKVRKYPFATRGQYQVSDTEQAGFYLSVGVKTKTYMLRVSVRGKVFKEKIAHADEMTASEARKVAAARAVDIKKSPPTKSGVTFMAAWKQYSQSKRAKTWSPRTVESYATAMDHLKDFHDRSLLDLASTADARTEVADAHKKMTAENGPYAANRAFELMRAVYNYIRPYHDNWPDIAPTKLVERNDEEEADDGLTDAELKKFYAAVQRAQNPVRRALHEFVLLSGHRPSAIKEAKWEDLNVKNRSLHIPNPKGGKKRAFDMPLSRPMLRVLNQAKKAGEIMHSEHAQTYIFPSAVGHVVEHKQNILTASHKSLRHTYGAIAASTGMPRLFSKLLMNHSVSSDVNDAYSANSSSFSDLLKWQETVSKEIMRRLAQ